MIDDAPAFDSDQIQALRDLGVIARQIEQLSDVLPICKALMAAQSAPAPMSEVREEIDALGRQLVAAGSQLLRLLEPDGPPARAEARLRLQEAAFIRAREAGSGRYQLDDEAKQILAGLGELVQAARIAFALLPKAQRRSRVASPIPVRIIHHALVSGWAQEYYPVGTGDASSYPTGPTPPFGLRVSTNITSHFRKIVGICYDAILGTQDNDPERAVRACAREQRAEQKARRVIVDSASFGGD